MVVNTLGLLDGVGLLVLTVDLSLDELAHALMLGIEVQVVDHIECLYFILLVLRQVPSILPQHFFGAHRELVAGTAVRWGL